MLCQKCGRENLDNAIFCHWCGTPLNPQIQSTISEIPRPKSRGFLFWAALGIGFLFVVIFIAPFVFGTVFQSDHNPPATIQQVIPSQTLVSTSVPTPVPYSKYVVGDIVAQSPTEDTSAKIVYEFNPDSNKYKIDTIYTDAFDKWGYRIYPNLEQVDTKWFEENYPFIIRHIDISNVATRSQTDPHLAQQQTYSNVPTQSQVSSSGGSDVSTTRECWVNGYYRKSGSYVNGYYRRC
jgi:hypothetical protein